MRRTCVTKCTTPMAEFGATIPERPPRESFPARSAPPVDDPAVAAVHAPVIETDIGAVALEQAVGLESFNVTPDPSTVSRL